MFNPAVAGKKIYFLTLIIFQFAVFLNAKPITVNEAQKAGSNYLIVKNKNDMFSASEISTIQNEDNRAILCYIIDLQPKGFIALSSDSDIIPIIAYSFRNNLIRNDENLLYYMIKKDMEFRLEVLPKFSSEKIHCNNILWEKYISGDISEFDNREFEQWPPEGSTSTTGWIETTWTQGYPYNMFCPLDPNTWQRCVTGCVATAMAQIINYHKYIGDVSFNYYIDHYWSNGINIDADSELYDFPSFEELNVYLDTLTVHYQNDEFVTNEDKAALNFACGISVEMWYSSSGSGAWTQQVASGLLNKFDYDSALWMESYHPHFYDSLSTNMINAKPAELAIYQSGGAGGHAINCDGYNTDDEYHLNFGWGAYSPDNITTAWYSLPEGMPAGYCIVNGAVINIEAGERPVEVAGNVYVEEVNPIGTFITFEGEYNYSTTVENADGSYTISTVFPGYYTATALLERLYYQTKQVYIDSANTSVDFNLFNYESVAGEVSIVDGTDPTGTLINITGDYNYSTVVDNSAGEYEIPDVMPGHYTATATLNRIYFQTQEVDIDSTNMIVDFELEDYSNQNVVKYYGEPTIVLNIGYEYTLGIAARFTPDELGNNVGDIICKVSFYTPSTSDSCDITIKVYEGGSPENPPGELVYEADIEQFATDIWAEHFLTIPIEIEPFTEYWIGYKIHTLDGKVGWMDTGPMEPEKGAWIKPSGWICLSQNPDYDRNWLIDMTLFSTIDVDMAQQSLSNEFVLQNYPNPFSASTTISFNFATDLHGLSPLDSTHLTGQAQIKIYNLKGQLVKNFELRTPNSEFTKVVWDGKDHSGKSVSNGVYFYQLKSENYKSEIKKMVLIR
ncbi:MAG: C10 family peptidase [Candidatus Cloacimonetes bacterium]|nr:C10 family peptidase [Candidatus Cloacimonadota bacterium]